MKMVEIQDLLRQMRDAPFRGFYPTDKGTAAWSDAVAPMPDDFFTPFALVSDPLTGNVLVVWLDSVEIDGETVPLGLEMTIQPQQLAGPADDLLGTITAIRQAAWRTKEHARLGYYTLKVPDWDALRKPLLELHNPRL